MIYSWTKVEQLQHLELTLSMLQTHHLVAKMTKCLFWKTQVEYLGPVASAKGVHVDPTKIEAIQAWPKPSIVKQLRGFLGLTGYYMKFMAKYAHTTYLIIELLKNNGFTWTAKANSAFKRLKLAMT